LTKEARQPQLRRKASAGGGGVETEARLRRSFCPPERGKNTQREDGKVGHNGGEGKELYFSVEEGDRFVAGGDTANGSFWLSRTIAEKKRWSIGLALMGGKKKGELGT